MKSRLLGAMCACLFTLVTTLSNAAVLPLEGRLETALGSGVFLAYYDPNLDITWAAEANINGSDTWDNQMSWAAGVTIGGITDWRLASMDRNRDGVIVDCAVATEAQCLDNEYGHLYFQHGVNAINQNPFSNILSANNASYWSGSEFDILSPDDGAWLFDFLTGGLSTNLKTSPAHFAWAVRTGNVPATVVPVPAAVWLFGSGLIGLLGIARRKR